MTGPGPGALISLTVFLLLLGTMSLVLKREPYVLSMALRFLRSRSKINMAMVCATCVGTMVITGSLIAGDSLEGSIESAAYENLGEVDEIVISDRLFSGSLVDRLAANESLMKRVDQLAPLIYLNGIAGNPVTGTRTGKADLVGFDHDFLGLGELISVDGNDLDHGLSQNEVYVNEKLAEEIQVMKGDRINLSFSRPDQLFEAIFLGSLGSTNVKLQFRVREVVKDESLGRFQLSAHRSPPLNVYVPLGSLQKVLGGGDVVNTILVSNNGGVREGGELSGEVSRLLERSLDEALGHEDAGLRVVLNPEQGYVKLESGNVFLPYSYHELLRDEPTLDSLAVSSPVLTYFWNQLSFQDRSVPYSTVAALDPALDAELGLFTLNESAHDGGGGPLEVEGRLEEGEIILNNWTAERLQAGVGDVVAMNYSVMDPFYTVRELTRNFTVRYVVDMVGKAGDPMLMPSFPGIEGKTSAFDWNPPFPMELGRITEDDEDYWQEFGGTPKAFISLESGNRLWKTDIGNITQLRLLPQAGSDLSVLEEQLEKVLDESVGMDEASLRVSPVKQDALDSAEGIAIFTQMFLAYSAACMVAAAILIILLVTLGIDSRMTEIGILRAIGFRKGTITHILLVEGLVLSIIGGLLGVLAGLLFGAFMTAGMNSFWSAMVEEAPVGFHVTTGSLVMGLCSGVAISILTMVAALRHEGKRTVVGAMRRLSLEQEKNGKGIMNPLIFFALGVMLAMMSASLDFQDGGGLTLAGLAIVCLALAQRGFSQAKGKRMDKVLGLVLVVVALLMGYGFADRAPVLELFFVSGFLMLSGLLLLFYHFLTDLKRTGPSDNGRKRRQVLGNGRWLVHFALRNAARRPKRTMFSVFLFSLTLFVLVSLSINIQGVVYDRDRVVEEGGGGYQILGESTSPIFFDLADEGSRADNDIHSRVFDELELEQFKTRGDAGGTCSNLNPNADPRIIGANESFFDNAFAFVSHARLEDGGNPWWLLTRPTGDDAIPAIGDYNTVVWILGLDLGSTIRLPEEGGGTVKLEIVGIIRNSIFQGSLIIWDRNFDMLYPTNPGYDLFLFRSEAGEQKPQMNELERALEEYGFDASSVESLVVESILVENTYIAVFQVILVFGLLIGTLGFGIVSSRNALERRMETGTLRAIGFTESMILRSQLLENSFVILCGIAIGAVSGIVAAGVYLVKMGLAVDSWPWGSVLAILVISYGCAMVSVLLPTLRSSKMPVSEARRPYE